MFAEAKKALPGLTALALVAATAAALSGDRALYGDPTGDVPLELPSRLGPWKAETVRFCQSDQCAEAFLESSLEPGAADCPLCGAPLGDISVGEMNLLPENTPIFRKAYRRAGHPDVTVTFVFSGMERRSIHKPQRCLVAQGNRITDEYTLRVPNEPLGPGKKTPVRALEISRPVRDGSGAVVGNAASVYAYWLFNPERETVHHWVRLARTIYDNAFRAYRPRWGYASIAVRRDPDSPDSWKDELADFLPRLYPAVSELRKELDARRNRVLRFSGHSWDANVYEGDNASLTKQQAAPSGASGPAGASK